MTDSSRINAFFREHPDLFDAIYNDEDEMTETKYISICPKLQVPCRHRCCANCVYSVKLGETWWCAWKAVDDD